MSYKNFLFCSALFALTAGGAVADPETYKCDKELTAFGDAVPFSSAVLEIRKGGDKEFHCQYGNEEAEKKGGSVYMWPPADQDCRFKGDEPAAVLGKTRLTCGESADHCTLVCEKSEEAAPKKK